MESLSVSIIGSGVWGRAFGHAIAAPHCSVIFYDYQFTKAEQAATVAYTAAATDITDAILNAQLIIVAVSSVAFSQTLQQLTTATVPIIWLTKGFATGDKPLYTVAAEILGAQAHYGVISGPSFASEVESGLPAALSLATNFAADAEWIRRQLHRRHLRLYQQDDLIGVCIGGAVKNIIAIAAGISDGFALGENARAALISRGLAEMTALSQALGGRPDTLLGLCGVGDLALTCCSDLSRNRQLGLAIAAGKQTAAATGVTCEGAAAAAAVVACATAHQLELPIVAAVAAVLAQRITPAAAVENLLTRPLR